MKRRLRQNLKRLGDRIVAALAIALVKVVRHIDVDRLSDIGGRLMRTLGPFFREHRIARDQLKVAFPDKSPAEIDSILRGVWDNLGRVGAEFADLDRLSNFDPQNPSPDSHIIVAPETVQRFYTLLNDGKPALLFTAHFANWELPAVIARAHKMDTAVLYRRPNNSAIDDWLRDTRGALMGTLIPAGRGAPHQIVDALRRGAHVGILVDQYYSRGVEVTFFGRRTRANPLLARIAEHFDCAIHGTYMVRLPNHRFRGEITDEIKPVRDAEGKVDVAATMQVIMDVIEGWIRAHPEQWLWLHRRWRPEDDKMPA
jgi:Kdo2-lipid IVA lauroyltransferase/acyltransferase